MYAIQLDLACSLIGFGDTWVSSVHVGSDHSCTGFFHTARVSNVIEGRLEGEHLKCLEAFIFQGLGGLHLKMKLHCALLLFNFVPAIIVIGFEQRAIAEKKMHLPEIFLAALPPVPNAAGNASPRKTKEVARIEPEFLGRFDAEVTAWERVKNWRINIITSRRCHCEVGLGSEFAECVDWWAAGWAIGGAGEKTWLWKLIFYKITFRYWILDCIATDNFAPTCRSRLSGLIGCPVCSRTPYCRSHLFSHPVWREFF